jgi:hypothetical protein
MALMRSLSGDAKVAQDVSVILSIPSKR